MSTGRSSAVIRLAEIARQTGRVIDAVNETWSLAARLEACAAEGRIDRDTLALLAHARLSLGVSLGTVLPEERHPTSAAWTGKALAVTRHLDAPALLARALRMHGNELRKAGRTRAAVARLDWAATVSTDQTGRAEAFALLARAAAENRDPAMFGAAITGCRRLVDVLDDCGMLANPYSLREIHARGLLDLGRHQEALRVLGADAGQPAGPQWQVIAQVTTGQILAAAGDRAGAADAFDQAVAAAEQRRLPHQLQRTVRAAHRHRVDAVAEAGRMALQRLNERLAPMER